jgi:hypothetical protein
VDRHICVDVVPGFGDIAFIKHKLELFTHRILFSVRGDQRQDALCGDGASALDNRLRRRRKRRQDILGSRYIPLRSGYSNLDPTKPLRLKTLYYGANPPVTTGTAFHPLANGTKRQVKIVMHKNKPARPEPDPLTQARQNRTSAIDIRDGFDEIEGLTMPLDAADHRLVLRSPLSSQRLGKRIHGTLSNVVRGLFKHLARISQANHGLDSTVRIRGQHT